MPSKLIREELANNEDAEVEVDENAIVEEDDNAEVEERVEMAMSDELVAVYYVDDVENI